MGVVARLTGRGDPLAEAEREIAQHAREVVQAGADLTNAKSAHDELFNSGGTDAELDVAARAVVLAERRVIRADIRRQTLAGERAALAAQARADLQRRLMGLAIAAGAAHAKNARAAAESGADYLAKRFALEQAGFHQAAIDLAPIPPFVMDHSGGGPNGIASPVNPMVDRFAFDLETLSRKISA